MKSRYKKRFCFAASMIALCVLLLGSATAETKKGFDAKREAFCKTMLNHAKQALARGDHEKAGYYFQKAVQADPTQMAARWFNQTNGPAEEDSLPTVTPTPPLEKSVQQGQTEEPFQVIMGDDGGC